MSAVVTDANPPLSLSVPLRIGDVVVPNRILLATLALGIPLLALAAEMGVRAEDVVAFGDMPNDLAMLEWAGTSYAMANAHPAALEAADRVALSNDDDGVAAVIEQLLAGSG